MQEVESYTLCDARDKYGLWYEARVSPVRRDGTVRVRYRAFGRGDDEIKRWDSDELEPPNTHVPDWRRRLKVSDFVEHISDGGGELGQIQNTDGHQNLTVKLCWTNATVTVHVDSDALAPPFIRTSLFDVYRVAGLPPCAADEIVFDHLQTWPTEVGFRGSRPYPYLYSRLVALLQRAEPNASARTLAALGLCYMHMEGRLCDASKFMRALGKSSRLTYWRGAIAAKIHEGDFEGAASLIESHPSPRALVEVAALCFRLAPWVLKPLFSGLVPTHEQFFAGFAADNKNLRAFRMCCPSTCYELHAPAVLNRQDIAAILAHRPSAFAGSVPDVCVLCLDCPPEVVFLPCRHCIVCPGCPTTPRCPMCRSFISTRL